MYGLALVTGPASEPVSLSEVKAHCRITDSAEDGLIASYILAARQHIETTCGLSLRQQTFDLFLDKFPDSDCPIFLPRGPAVSITSVQYIDIAGATQTWSSANYQLDARRVPARLFPGFGLSYPSVRDIANAVTVRFVAGYADTALPDTLRSALLLLVGHYYENREPVNVGNIVNMIPLSVEALLAPHRAQWFA